MGLHKKKGQQRGKWESARFGGEKLGEVNFTRGQGGTKIEKIARRAISGMRGAVWKRRSLRQEKLP